MAKLFIIKIPIALLMLLSFQGRDSGKNNHVYSTADKIEIRFLKTEKPLHYFTSNKDQLVFFKYLIDNGVDKPGLKCDSTGEIIYLKGNTPVFHAYFSTRISGSKVDGAVSYVINNREKMTLLTYNTGMTIDELFYQLTQKP